MINELMMWLYLGVDNVLIMSLLIFVSKNIVEMLNKVSDLARVQTIFRGKMSQGSEWKFIETDVIKHEQSRIEQWHRLA